MNITAAFDAVLASASLEMDSFAWESKTTFAVAVNGCAGRKVIRGRCTITTPAGLRSALSTVLRDYCAMGAVEAAAN
mgnify:FL=1